MVSYPTDAHIFFHYILLVLYVFVLPIRSVEILEDTVDDSRTATGIALLQTQYLPCTADPLKRFSKCIQEIRNICSLYVYSLYILYILSVLFSSALFCSDLFWSVLICSVLFHLARVKDVDNSRADLSKENDKEGTAKQNNDCIPFISCCIDHTLFLIVTLYYTSYCTSYSMINRNLW